MNADYANRMVKSLGVSITDARYELRQAEKANEPLEVTNALRITLAEYEAAQGEWIKTRTILESNEKYNRLVEEEQRKLYNVLESD